MNQKLNQFPRLALWIKKFANLDYQKLFFSHLIISLIMATRFIFIQLPFLQIWNRFIFQILSCFINYYFYYQFACFTLLSQINFHHLIALLFILLVIHSNFLSFEYLIRLAHWFLSGLMKVLIHFYFYSEISHYLFFFFPS